MGQTTSKLLLTVVFSGIFGLMIGSFLNVVVYRVPRGLSIVSPGSFCPSCGTPLRSADNVPLISYAFLRARCRTCGAPISVRYPLIEATTGLVFAGLAAVVGPSAPLLPLLVLAAATIAASAIDVDGLAVPWSVVLAAAVGAAGLLVADLAAHPSSRLGWAAAAAVAAGLLGWFGERLGAGRTGAPTAGSARRVAVGVCLAWAAGWLWPAGGLATAGWIAVVEVLVASGAGALQPAPARAGAGSPATEGARSLTLALVAAGSLGFVLVGALVGAPTP
ncbi:MAG TPA: prepilin peptidase [Acidimicrobiales bacterium]|nr:prepilin peptidase [Acidimicrobiales bacterium]